MASFYHRDHPPPLYSSSSSASYYTNPYPPPPPPPGASPPPPPPSIHSYSSLHACSHHSSPPPPHLAIPPLYSGASAYLVDDEVRTLFIAGLPEDTKHREIYNLFREFPGYESFQLRINRRSSQAYAFVVFSDQQSAISAKHALNGLRFDLERDCTLSIELAKSNSRGKHSRTDDDVAYTFNQTSKRFSRGFEDSGHTTLTGLGSNTHISTGHLAHSSNIGFLSELSSSGFEQAHETNPSNLSFSKFAPGGNPPCPTLFVANLGSTCSHEELSHVFSRWPGFVQIKMQKKFGRPVAFVDFKDEESATSALNHLQGNFLHSSEGEGMRVEYAKSRMGLRKSDRR